MDNENFKRKSSKLSSPTIKRKRINLANKPNENPTPEDVILLMENYRRSKEDMEILSNYCKKNESLMAILQMNSKGQGLSNDIFINNLVSQFEYTYYSKGKTMFNYGDVGDRFYILIKGEVVILVPQERNISLTYFDYLSYLRNMYKANEIALVNKCLEANSSVFEANIDLKLIEKLVSGENEKQILKDKFQEEQEKFNGDCESEFRGPLGRINSFSQNPPYKKSSIRHTKRMYTKKLIQSQTQLESSVSIDDYLKAFNYPEDLGKQLFQLFSRIKIPRRLFSDKIAMPSPSKPDRKKKSTLKSQENFENLIESSYRMDDEEIRKLKTEKKQVKIFKFISIKTVCSGDSFGDIALQTTKNKRTASIFVTKNSSFLFLIKQSFDDTIGEIHQRIINEKIQFLKSYLLFQFCQNHFLLENYYYYFHTALLPLGGIVLQQGDEISQTAFIRHGTFEVYIEASVKQVYEYIKSLRYSLNDIENCIYDHSNNPSFQGFFNSKKRFNICKLSSGEYIGFQYEYFKSGKSLVTVECTSHTSEVMYLKNFDLCRLLSDYNNYIFSSSNEFNFRSEESRHKSNCLIKSGKPLGSKVEIDKGTSLGNFLDNFSIDISKNPVHKKYLESNEVMSRVTVDRLLALLIKYFKLHFEIGNAYSLSSKSATAILNSPVTSSTLTSSSKKKLFSQRTSATIDRDSKFPSFKKEVMSRSTSNFSYSTYSKEKIKAKEQEVETEIKNLKQVNIIKHLSSRSVNYVPSQTSATEIKVMSKTIEQNSFFLKNVYEQMQKRGSNLRKTKMSNLTVSVNRRSSLANKLGENLVINLETIKGGSELKKGNISHNRVAGIKGYSEHKHHNQSTAFIENMIKARANKKMISFSIFTKNPIIEKLHEEAQNLSIENYKSVNDPEKIRMQDDLIDTIDIKEKYSVKPIDTIIAPKKIKSLDFKLNVSFSNTCTDISTNCKSTTQTQIKSFDFSSILIKSEGKPKDCFTESCSEIQNYKMLKDSRYFDKQNYFLNVGILKSGQLNLLNKLTKAKFTASLKNNLKRRRFDSTG